jgi:C1A family cysteine protease
MTSKSDNELREIVRFCVGLTTVIIKKKTINDVKYVWISVRTQEQVNHALTSQCCLDNYKRHRETAALVTFMYFI